MINEEYLLNRDLLNSIEEKYGFKRELIRNPELCGLWFVRFEVNGIKYIGSIPFHGALPQLKVTGYITEHYNENSTPVEDWYYEEFIKDKQARLLRCIDAEAGDWEDTGIRFKNQEEVEEYMSNLDENDASNLRYEMIQDWD